MKLNKPVRVRMTGRQRINAIKRSRWLYLIILLPLIYYAVFCYAPMYGILIAFKDYKISKGVLGSKWVGVKWFAKFIGDPYFWKLVRNTLLLNFYGLVVGFPIPIVLALMLNEVSCSWYKKIIQTLSYLPHFLSTVVVCGMVVNFLSLDGIINRLIAALGGQKIQFMMMPEWFRTVFTASGIWQSMGWNSIVYLAALTAVDSQLLEAAEIDGANRFQRIFHVALPAITPTISIMLIMQLGRMMNLGHEKILLLYNGSTYETADVISTYVYRRGILKADYSYSTAVGLFQTFVSLILLTTSNAFSKRLSETSLW